MNQTLTHSPRLQDAIHFALDVHETQQHQKRKGKDVPYIVHPLNVGILLAQVGANEDVIIAGILHDTIEDSAAERKVTEQMLATRFGNAVASIVASVSEEDKRLPWRERKQAALDHIAGFSDESLLVKAADILSNTQELMYDYAEDGIETFSRFNAEMEDYISNQCKVIKALRDRWTESPLDRALFHALVAYAQIVGEHSTSK